MDSIIVMVNASEYSRKTYGVTHRSRYVYNVAGSHAPTRIDVWSNVNRPNLRDGQAVRYGQYGPLDGGCGRYLDPSNHATDAPVSVLLTPESSCISARGDGTGSEASGQVYSPDDTPLRTGDTLTLRFPLGPDQTYKVRLTNNGHGIAE